MDLVLYDGVCGLCNRSVRFLLDRDRHDRFRYAALQRPLAAQVLAKYGYDPSDLDTFYAVVDYQTPRERVLRRGRAALFVLRRIGGAWGAAAVVAGILPTFALDVGYRFIAKRRYRWFGKLDACPLPRPGDAAKFLDGSATA